MGAAAAGLVAVAFSQQPGRIVGDTKIDLVVAPAAFLGRSLSAWDPHASLGQLQNQSYGYLFPMGPFFLLGHLLHIPAWVVQRSWWSLLLLLAFTGCLRVARLLDIGTPTARMFAAFAYAASPRVLTVLGGISVEALPLALLPWVLSPLVSGERTGSARRAALRSALAVACIGGVNAAATLAVLPLPAIYLLTRERTRRRAALLGWWLVGLVLATSWWVLPLLVLRRYAFPFLDYIETASVTTSVDSITNVLRGTSHWMGFLPVHGHAFWTAGSQLAVGSVEIVATTVVAALGLAGLCAPRMRERRFLLLAVVVGVCVISVGYAGALSSPLSPFVRHLLDGPLAAFRNVHKFDPVLRLPIALGLCHVVSALPRPGRFSRYAPAVVASSVAAVLLVATAPAMQGRLAPDGAFDQVPSYWRDAARYIDRGARGDETLLVPATRFGEYAWGRPMDEPLGALSTTRWAVRNAVPLGAPGATRLLDALNERMASGAGSAGLAPALARAGIRYVLLRNDIDPWRSGALPPPLFRSALMQSPGLRLAASFGPATPPAGTSATGPPAIEVFEVADPTPEAVVYPASGVDVLSGGPEAALPLADLRLDDPTVAVADAEGRRGRAVVVTDTLRRRQLNFGADAGSDYSPTLSAGVDPSGGRPAADVLPFDGVAHQTTSVLIGARSLSASSSASDPFALAYRGPQARPASAMDGDAGTAWISDDRPVGQWLQLTLRRAVDVSAGRIQMVVDPWVGPPVTTLEVRTDAGVQLDTLRPTSAPQTLLLPPGPTRTIRLTVRQVAGSASTGAVGISELSVPGVAVSESVVPPQDSKPLTASGVPTAYVFSRPDGFRGNCYRTATEWACSPGLAQPGEEVAALDRSFELRKGRVNALVTARPRVGPALDALLDSTLGFEASASSRLVADPAARPGAAFDDDPATAWIGAAGDVHPQLRLTLPRPATVRSLQLSGTSADLARIRTVTVRAKGESRVLTYHPGDHVTFRPLTGRTFTVDFGIAAALGGVPPLRVAEVSLGGLKPLASSAVRVPCASGPSVTLDGQVHRTSLHADVQQLLGLGPVRATLCDPVWTLQGTSHRLIGESSPTFDVVGVAVGDPAALHGGDATATRSVRVTRWDAEHREVTVMPGQAGYLTLTEGANDGWNATVNGQRLRPVRLDGWRQGWLLPAASSPERVSLTFTPGRWHRAGLLIGALALMVLVLGACIPGRRDADETPHDRSRGRGPSTAARSRWIAVPLLGVLAIVLIGPWGVALVPLALLLPQPWRPAVAGVMLAAAGLGAVIAGWSSGVSQLMAAVAVTVSAASLAPAVMARLR